VISESINTFIYFFWATTAFDIFGTDNAEELNTCGFQYPSLSISILHFVARIFGRNWYNFALLNDGESGKLLGKMHGLFIKYLEYEYFVSSGSKWQLQSLGSEW
jgi:hypothetical protein